jgi:hypothetical protein
MTQPARIARRRMLKAKTIRPRSEEDARAGSEEE